MPHYAANRGLHTLMNAAISGSTDLRAAVFKGPTTTLTDALVADMNTLADVEADANVTEAVAAGYARLDLAGVTLAEVDASDSVTLVATAPTTANIAVGETWTAIAYYIEAGTDATRLLISVDVPAAALVTNGGPVTLPAFSMTLTNP